MIRDRWKEIAPEIRDALRKHAELGSHA